MDQSAPFLNDVFEWPKGAITSYATTSDGIKIRTGVWAARNPIGTVFVYTTFTLLTITGILYTPTCIPAAAKVGIKIPYCDK